MTMKASFNHLKRYYSDYNLYFLKSYYKELKPNFKIVDIGCGHMRNLRLFYDVGFKRLYGVDWQQPKPNFDYSLYDIGFIQRDIKKGLPLNNNFSDVTLCNYVLMFIEKNSIDFVLDELIRISSNYLIIETYKQHQNIINHQKSSDFKNYNFKCILDYILDHSSFKILDRKQAEKAIFRIE